MIRIGFLALAIVAGISSVAQAQVAPQVVAACGAGILQPLGPGGRTYVDQAGNTCMAAGMGDLASAGPGGISNFSRIPASAASSNLTNAKATAGRAYTYQGCNTTASTIYMRLYNAAATGAVTVGTTAPVSGPYAFPANTCIQTTDFANNIGVSLPAGITYAFGTAPADTDATAITAGAITAFQIGYQ